MAELVKAEYQGIAVAFTEDAWFNATEVAERFNKRPADWLNLKSTKEYILVLCEVIRSEESSLLKVKRGGRGKTDSTWFHPKLAVRFAQWLDARFAVWCDDQIHKILTGNHPHYDWKKMKHEASSSFKVMNAVLQLHRQSLGKPTEQRHYMNEAKLINWLVKGEFKGIDRNGLSIEELDLLAKLEERNTVLMGCGFTDYRDRKPLLEKFATDWRRAHEPSRQLSSETVHWRPSL